MVGGTRARCRSRGRSIYRWDRRVWDRRVWARRWDVRWGRGPWWGQTHWRIPRWNGGRRGTGSRRRKRFKGLGSFPAVSCGVVGKSPDHCKTQRGNHVYEGNVFGNEALSLFQVLEPKDNWGLRWSRPHARLAGSSAGVVIRARAWSWNRRRYWGWGWHGGRARDRDVAVHRHWGRGRPRRRRGGRAWKGWIGIRRRERVGLRALERVSTAGDPKRGWCWVRSCRRGRVISGVSQKSPRGGPASGSAFACHTGLRACDSLYHRSGPRRGPASRVRGRINIRFVPSPKRAV